MISKKGFIDFVDKKNIAITATSFAIGLAASDFLRKIIDTVLEPIQKKVKRDTKNKTIKKIFEIFESFLVLFFTLVISYVIFAMMKKYLKIT